MKLFIKILIIGLITSCNTTKILEPKGYQSFKIIKIDTVKYHSNNIYYAKFQNSIYKIVTKKEKINPCSKIELNKTYKLLIQSTAPKILKNRLDYSGAMMYEGESVDFEGGKIVWDLFITNDIKDACYTFRPKEDKTQNIEQN
jgi:hypothetical protein